MPDYKHTRWSWFRNEGCGIKKLSVINSTYESNRKHGDDTTKSSDSATSSSRRRQNWSEYNRSRSSGD